MEEEATNFELERYFETITDSVDRSIEEAINKLQPQLSQYLKSKNVNNVSEKDLGEGCIQLLHKIKQNFEKNIAKFQLYSIRNVFNPSLGASSSSSSSENVNSSSSASALQNGTVELDAEEQELDRTLLRLRNNYMKLQRDYLQISTECRDMDTLLKEMRSAMFNLRVALQSLEDFEISPLSETTYLVSQYQIKLQQCVQNGQDLLLRIKHYEENQQATEEENEAVRMDTTDTVQLLSKGFQG